MDLIAIQNGYFLVRFASVADYEHARFEGPWTVLDHCLAVKDWEPDFDPMRDQTQRLLVWVHFLCLPIEYYDYEFLMRVGDIIGTTRKVDHATSMASRGLFARVCVEVDITKPLLARFTLRNKMRTIEYEGLHLVCFRCGMVGHWKETCKLAQPQETEESPKTESGGTENTGDPTAEMRQGPTWKAADGKADNQGYRRFAGDKYGSWMIAMRKPRNFQNQGNHRKSNGRNSGVNGENSKGRSGGNQGGNGKNFNKEGFKIWDNSRYGVLDNLEDENEETNEEAFTEMDGTDGSTGTTLAGRETDNHTVVRGYEKGSRVEKTIINEEGSMIEVQHTQEEAGEHHQDPPDGGIPMDSGGNEDPMMDVEFTEGQSSEGAASSGFRRALLLLVNNVKANLIGLVEPRISGSAADRACRSFGFDNWIRVKAVGFSGGIWLLWRNNINVEVMATNPQFILTKVSKGNGTVGLVSFVYSNPSHHFRKKLWNSLSIDNFSLNEEWISVGDYNAVTCMEDVSNKDNFHNHRCAGMNHWIFKEGLIDMGFVGGRYTWTRGRDSSTFTGARLDRALCNLEWITKYPNTKVVHLPRVCSDHSPLLIDLGLSTEVQRSRTFHYQATWSSHPDFNNIISQCWNGDRTVRENISNMQATCANWSREIFGNIDRRKHKMLARIKGIQTIMDSKPHNGLIKLERKLRLEL
ncbi:uncharacterized protein LOC116029829 [Ipomoea triloba]|uniref:uncharacterized protein LOC116029829 n=1 Tax=Ipomoea triloba TaxID=35885 RepID=UPI00125E5A73|nr:uncharacterized protein LOC116029829 [Ipomoea triloba]